MSESARGSLYAFLAAWIAVAAPAAAQAAEVQAPPPAAVQELIVTGSHIPRPDLSSVSPLTALTHEQIAVQGRARLEDVVATLPQAYVGQSSNTNNGATGTATVDLRMLGPERTLVLIDGKRLMPGDPTSGSVAPDLNFVPTALVERVEVVTGGASAVYGSDAIAGVVNLILQKSFTGVRLDLHAGTFDHVNREAGLAAIIAGHGYGLPAHRVDDGQDWSADLAAGWATPDGRGSLMGYAGYRRTRPVTQAERDFSACSFISSAAGLDCLGSTRAVVNGRFQVFNPVSFRRIADLTLDPAGPPGALRPFVNGRDAFNNAPFQYFQRQDVRWTAGLFASWRAAPWAEGYLQAMGMDDFSHAQLAPSGLFATFESLIGCDNPLLSAAEVKAFCTNAGLGPGGVAHLFIGKRNIEGGPRSYELGHRDWRVLAGMRGEAGAWSYDLSAQAAKVRMRELALNDVSNARAAEALDVVAGADGQPVCRSLDPACAPYDLFRLGGVTPAAVAFLSTPGRATGATGESVVSLTATGQLSEYGLRSPWARNGLGVALGAEYRRDSLDYAPDAELASGDLASSGEAEPAVAGAIEVAEAYGELRAPIVEDRPWLYALALETGARYSSYSTAGGSWTWKAGAEWAPSPDGRFRVSFNHAVRAPNVVDLFTPQTVGVGIDTDPCAGDAPAAADPAATPQACLKAGVPLAQYGFVAVNDEGYNLKSGGNLALKPESADTVTLGVVLSPRALPGLNLTLDWYDIKLTQALDTVGGGIIEQCLQTGAAFFCNLVHRDPATASLWLGSGFVDGTLQNVAAERARGVDLQADYRRALPALGGGELGSFAASLVGTWVYSADRQSVPGGTSVDCAGLYGPACGSPRPRWRHVLRLSWASPWDLDVSLAWRFVQAVKLDRASDDPALAGPFNAVDAHVAARSYFDLAASWRAGPHLTVRVGANNLLDQDPPVVGFGGSIGNGNAVPGLYDVLGRQLFVDLSARF